MWNRDQIAETRVTPTSQTAPRVEAQVREHVPGFDLLEELGRGGMGVVYKARQHGLNRTVALKMLLASSRLHDSERLRFLTEAEAVAAVKHPNVVQVYECGDADEAPVPGDGVSSKAVSLARLLTEQGQCHSPKPHGSSKRPPAACKPHTTRASFTAT